MSDELSEPIAPPAELSEEELQSAVQAYRDQQSLPGALFGGAIAALVGAVIWAFVTVLTGYQIGWMAIGVGFLVGIAVQKLGKGIDPIFGVIGAGFALLGCIMGNLFAIFGFIAEAEGISVFSVLSHINISAIPEAMFATFGIMDVLFYGIAIVQGFQIARKN